MGLAFRPGLAAAVLQAGTGKRCLGTSPAADPAPGHILLRYVVFENTNFQLRESAGVCFPAVPGEAAAASALPGDTEAALCG